MYDMVGVSLIGCPEWQTHEDQDYENACRDCEHEVMLTPALHRHMKHTLFYDTSKTGARGRALTQAIPEVGLLAGDRLEPCAALADIVNVVGPC